MLNWNERRKLNEKINREGAWEPACPDGHTVLLARSDNPTVFFIDEEGNVNRMIQYNFPRWNLVNSFLVNGEPYIVDSQDKTLYFLHKDGSPA